MGRFGGSADGTLTINVVNGAPVFVADAARSMRPGQTLVFTGAELLATLQYLGEHPDAPTEPTPLGPPHCATGGPCRRCWIYPRAQDDTQYCQTCREILRYRLDYTSTARHTTLIWGFLNQLPVEVLRQPDANRQQFLVGCYIHDTNHFLVAMDRHGLKLWLQELTVYHGLELRGILQIAISIALLALVLRRIEWEELRAALARMSLPWEIRLMC